MLCLLSLHENVMGKSKNAKTAEMSVQILLVPGYSEILS